ncbi:amidohydrolase family protein [Buttiauxella sp.]|uniref:amidohydrolase family protein n=1 Tax=Buttiauxella sp. TaxID=1972222 RepID=UPI003C74B13A
MSATLPLPRQLNALLEIADPKHILYGSDYPYTPEALVTTLATQLDDSSQLTDVLRADYMRNNALTLFPRFA